MLDTGLALDDLQFQNYEIIQTLLTITSTAPVEPYVNSIQALAIPNISQKK